MSVLESLAKSSSEVHKICLNNCKAHDCAKCELVSWVPLDIAMNRERIMSSTIALQARTISSQIIHNKNVNDTRDEANRLLDELLTVLTANPVECYTLPALDRIGKIKEALNSIYHKEQTKEVLPQ